MAEDLGEQRRKSEKRFTETQEEQMLEHVTAAMSMVRELPRFAHDRVENVPGVVRVACLESFFMNVRLIIEFLIMVPQKRDFGASTVADFWTPPESQVEQRLMHWWRVASRHVAHFSMERIATDPEAVEYEDTSLDGLLRIAADCEAEWKRFELVAGIYLGPYTAE